jgi:hypothetical protein
MGAFITNILQIEKLETFFYSILPNFGKSIAFWQVLRFRPSVFLVRDVDKEKYRAAVE